MAFHFSNIMKSLTRRFNKKNSKDNKSTGTADSKSPSTKELRKVPTHHEQNVEGPMSVMSSSSSSIYSVPAVPESQLLPYAQYVTLSPEEVKFNCQTRVMAHEVKYSMVTTVVNSWERDLKTIPNWDKIGGEILLRK